MKELNKWIRNENVRLFSFSAATPKQLLHYLDVNLDCITITVILYVGISKILNDTSTSNIRNNMHQKR